MLDLTFNGGFQPSVETDRNGAVDVTGYPTCRPSQLQSTTSDAARKNCGDALIGTGKTQAEVQPADQNPVIVNSELLVSNGGTKGGVTTLYVHADFSAPVVGAIVTAVKVKKIHNGRYGTLSVASIPKIAGGSGSVKSFSLEIDKKFTYKGRIVSILTAKCPDGKLQAKAKAVFFNYKTSETTTASAEIIRTCTGKG